MTIASPLDAPVAAIPENSLVTSPILPTLLKLALPNAVAMFGSTLVAVAETSYIGRLGIEPLAGIALVFPFVMLTQMMSAGAMGGGVSSAISRALGAGDRDRAATLALHAAIIGACSGLFFTAMMLLFGRQFFTLLGGRGGVLEQACNYSVVLFSGAVSIWLVNTLASVLRGTGDMRLPSATLIGVAIVQTAVGGALGLGLAGLPRFGMHGVAAGQLIAFSLGAIFLLWYLVSGRSRLTLNFKGFTFQRDMFFDILKVGAVSCLSPLQGVLTISIFTHMLAGFGTAVLAGYGIGARLEFMLTSVAFSVGIASVPMIGMAIGAERIARARRIAWIAGLVSFISVGAIATVIAIFPDLWVNIFTHDEGVRAASRQYLSTAAPCYAFLGLAMSMYFSSQGAAKVVGPVLAQSGRLLLIGGGGWYLTTHGATAADFFTLAAASMVVLGVSSCSSVILTRWGPKRATAAPFRSALPGVAAANKVSV